MHWLCDRCPSGCIGKYGRGESNNCKSIEFSLCVLPLQVDILPFRQRDARDTRGTDSEEWGTLMFFMNKEAMNGGGKAWPQKG